MRRARTQSGSAKARTLRTARSQPTRKAATAALAARAGLSTRVEHRLNLVLEEIIGNTIAYGYPDGGEHALWVRLAVLADAIELEIRDDARPFDLWVLTIARRLSIDALRRGARRERLTGDGTLPEIAVEPLETSSVGADPTLGTEALMTALRAAVETLPEGQRAVVALHKLDGLPLAEVAARLGIREGAARVRAHRGYSRLRELLGLGGGDDT